MSSRFELSLPEEAEHVLAQLIAREPEDAPATG